MFCHNCGKKIEENELFCTGCGTRIGTQGSNKEQDTYVQVEAPDNSRDAYVSAQRWQNADSSADKAAKKTRQLTVAVFFIVVAIIAAITVALIAGLILSGTVRVQVNDMQIGDYKIEGKGYSSPEEALTAYLEAMRDKDYNKILSTCAVESYCENYDAEAYVDRMKSITMVGVINNISLPSDDAFIKTSNIQKRRAQLTRDITYQLVAFAYGNTPQSDAFDELYEQSHVESEEYNVKRLLKDLQNIPNLDKLEVLEPVYGMQVSDGYLMAPSLNSFKKQAEIYGAEGIKSLGMMFDIEGKKGILFADTIKYNGRWYVAVCSGICGSYAGINLYRAGMVFSKEPCSKNKFFDSLGIDSWDEVKPETENAIEELRDNWDEWVEEDHLGFLKQFSNVDEMMDFFSMTECR